MPNRLRFDKAIGVVGDQTDNSAWVCVWEHKRQITITKLYLELILASIPFARQTAASAFGYSTSEFEKVECIEWHTQHRMRHTSTGNELKALAQFKVFRCNWSLQLSWCFMLCSANHSFSRFCFFYIAGRNHAPGLMHYADPGHSNASSKALFQVYENALHTAYVEGICWIIQETWNKKHGTHWTNKQTKNIDCSIANWTEESNTCSYFASYFTITWPTAQQIAKKDPFAMCIESYEMLDYKSLACAESSISATKMSKLWTLCRA